MAFSLSNLVSGLKSTFQNTFKPTQSTAPPAPSPYVAPKVQRARVSASLSPRTTSSGYDTGSINQAYQSILGRQADPEGLRHYGSGESGLNGLEALQNDLMGSGEYKNRLGQLSGGFLGEGGSSDLSASLGALKSPLEGLYPTPDRPTIDNARGDYLAALRPTREQTDLQNQITNLEGSYKAGDQKIQDETIPMDLITGQQRSLANQFNNQSQTLNSKLANLQQQQQAKVQQAQAKLDFTDQDIQGFLNAQKETQALNDKQMQQANDVVKFALDNFAGSSINDIINHPTTLNYLQQLGSKAGVPVGLILKALSAAQKQAQSASHSEGSFFTNPNTGEVYYVDPITGKRTSYGAIGTRFKPAAKRSSSTSSASSAFNFNDI